MAGEMWHEKDHLCFAGFEGGGRRSEPKDMDRR